MLELSSARCADARKGARKHSEVRANIQSCCLTRGRNARIEHCKARLCPDAHSKSLGQASRTHLGHSAGSLVGGGLGLRFF